MRLGLVKRLSGRLLALSLIAAALPLLGAPAALAAPRAPIDLAPDQVTVGDQPVLTWARLRAAVEYDVQISTLSNFSTTIYDETTVNTHATPLKTLPQGVDLYWRVRGANSSGAHGPWADAGFQHTTTEGPTQLTPEDGASLQQPEEPPLLTWVATPGAVSYSVEVDTDDQFVDATTYTSKTAAFVVPDPGPQQTYYWHVRANLSDGVSTTWSQDWSFEVLALAAPELISPDDSATAQVQDAVLDWAPVAGAVRYEVRVSTDDQFNDPLDEVLVKSTRYARPKTYLNDQYWWQVRAVDVNGNQSPWSTSLNRFQRNWPDRPSLIFPANGQTVEDGLYYEWDPIPHASEYELQVGGDPSFSPGSYGACTTEATTYTTGRTASLACRPVGLGTYYWRVRGIDDPAGVTGIFSTIRSFNFDPGMVNQLTPLDGETVEVPALSWEAYPDAEKYDVTVMKSNGAVVASANTYSLSWTPTGSTRLKAVDGPFHWTVEALFKDQSLTTVPIFGFDRTFSLVETVTDTLQPALAPTSPTGVHSLRFPALTWEPWFNPGPEPAAYYRVFVGLAGGGGVTQIPGNLPYPSATDNQSTFLQPGSYRWFARAYDEDGTTLGTGPDGYFTIDNLEPPTGSTLSLTGEGLLDEDTSCDRTLSETPTVDEICSNLQQTPVLSWDPVPGAGYYMIYLSRDRELTNLVYSPQNTLTVNTAWVPTDLLPDSQAGTAYYWVIRPCKTAGYCAPDPTEATQAFDKRSNSVSGLVEREHESDDPLPPTGPGGASDPPEFADEIVLSWDDYLVTNGAGNDADVTGLASTLEAQTYRVQIGPDPNFSSDTITSALIDQTTYAPYTATLPEGPLYWRVQAVDASGNSLPWSKSRTVGGGTATIEKRSPSPTLLMPDDGDTVSGTPAFTWAPLAYAAKYTIQVARHGDTTFSTANRVFSITTEQASYVPTTVLDASAGPYVWRVRRSDVDSNAGQWSEPLTFGVAAPAPTLISPLAAAYVSAKDALFTWGPADGAVTYRFERRVQGAASSQETRTTVGLNWAPTSTIADGRYEWRVSSYDLSSQLLASSPWSPFSVDNTAPTAKKMAPLDRAKPTSNFTVDFSEKVKGVSFDTFAIFLKGKSQRLAATVKLNKKKNHATLDPAGRLKVGKVYTVKLLSGISDGADLPLKPISWNVKIQN